MSEIWFYRQVGKARESSFERQRSNAPQKLLQCLIILGALQSEKFSRMSRARVMPSSGRVRACGCEIVALKQSKPCGPDQTFILAQRQKEVIPNHATRGNLFI